METKCYNRASATRETGMAKEKIICNVEVFQGSQNMSVLYLRFIIDFDRFQGNIKSHIKEKDPNKFDTPSERYDSSVQYNLVGNNDDKNNNQAEKEYMKDDFASEPENSPSRSFYSIVESAFPEHKYLQNQRTTYVER